MKQVIKCLVALGVLAFIGALVWSAMRTRPIDNLSSGLYRIDTKSEDLAQLSMYTAEAPIAGDPAFQTGAFREPFGFWLMGAGRKFSQTLPGESLHRGDYLLVTKEEDGGIVKVRLFKAEEFFLARKAWEVWRAQH